MVFCIGVGVLAGILTRTVDIGVTSTSDIATITELVQVFGFKIWWFWWGGIFLVTPTQ